MLDRLEPLSGRLAAPTRNRFAGSAGPGWDAGSVKGATNHLTPGEKVAYYRRRRGMTQEVVAELVGKTTSWIEEIESGRANLQMLPNIASLAEVLDISPFELLPDDIVQVDANTRGRSVPALRKQLLSYRFVNPRYLEDQAEPMTMPDLTAAVANIWAAYQGLPVRVRHRRAAPPAAARARDHAGRAGRSRRRSDGLPLPGRFVRADQGRGSGPRLHLRRPR